MICLKWLVAATVLLAASLTWMNPGARSLGPTAFADEIPGIDQVRQMTWTVTFYIRVSSKDGKQNWVEKERRLFAYRHPGQYRETRMNRSGEVAVIVISDHNAGRMLELRMKEKKASLKTLDHRADPRGPFAWQGDALRHRDLPGPTRVKSLSMQGTTKVDNVDVNVARIILQDTEQGKLTRLDMYFDPTTKQLTGMWCPNNGTDEPDDLEQLADPHRTDWGRMEPVAALTHDIQLQPNLIASDFSLDVPNGFTAETIATPTVTEDEMIGYLKAAVVFNDHKFPDMLFSAFDSDRLNAEWAKDETARSASAIALISQVDKFRLREIYQSPVQRFVTDNTLPDSFQFAGSGATFGQADQIICWYRLKHGKQLRAVYGDLSVRDVTEDDLPFSNGK
jgi:hypothetical protein